MSFQSARQSSERDTIREMIEQFGQCWLEGEAAAMPLLMQQEVQLISHQHGEHKGRDAVLQALSRDTAAAALLGQTSNHYIAVDGDQAAASMYLFGLKPGHKRQYFLFGAALVMRLQRHENGWLFSEIRLQVNWSHGDRGLMSHWKNVPGEHGWKMGDEPPVLVSELHSPWALLPDAPVPESLPEALSELYARYSFAVDQNDMSLLTTAYSQDISGGFAPVGNFSGHDKVISILKNFRHLASVWQHFAHVVRVEDEGDGRHAKMIIARIIPEPRSMNKVARCTGRTISCGYDWKMIISGVSAGPIIVLVGLPRMMCRNLILAGQPPDKHLLQAHSIDMSSGLLGFLMTTSGVNMAQDWI
ncbi:nuclear transport factor 2 family protein [Vibrio sp. CDRSL-10 TSBA]